MTTIAARLYHDGKVADEIDLDEPIPHITRPADFIWIGLHEPDDGVLKRCVGGNPCGADCYCRDLRDEF